MFIRPQVEGVPMHEFSSAFNAAFINAEGDLANLLLIGA